MRTYRPRRAGARWREGAPAYILDCFDDPREIDRYTVMIYDPDEVPSSRGEAYVDYLSMSGAASISGELAPHEAVAYRYRNKRRRVRWLDLPPEVRAHVEWRVSTWRDVVADG